MGNPRTRLVLLVDDSQESQDAIRRLKGLDVDLVIVRSSGTSVPTARLGNTSYIGRWGIDFVADCFSRKQTSSELAKGSSV